MPDSKKKLTKQEQNLKDAMEMKNMRPVFKGPNSYLIPTKRPDTPLAPTPAPKTKKTK
jgi:hypothetical protein